MIAVINYINANGSGRLPDVRPAGSPFVDVTGDQSVAADDVIAVINFIIANPDREGEVSASFELRSTELCVANSVERSEQSMAPDLMSLLSLDVAAQSKRKRKRPDITR